MNLSHAVSIVLYELYQTAATAYPGTRCLEEERELLHKYFARLLVAIDYPEFRRENTATMFAG